MHTDFICIYCHKSLININKCCLQISNLYLCFIAFSFLGLYTRLHHCSMNTAVNRYILSTFWNHPCQILSKYVPAVSCSGAVNHEWSCSEWCSSAALQHKYEPLFRKQNLTVLHTIYNIYTTYTLSTIYYVSVTLCSGLFIRRYQNIRVCRMHHRPANIYHCHKQKYLHNVSYIYKVHQGIVASQDNRGHLCG